MFIIWKVGRIENSRFSLPGMRCHEELRKERLLDRRAYQKARREREELAECGKLARSASLTISANVFRR